MLLRDDNGDDSESESDTVSTSTSDTPVPWILVVCTSQEDERFEIVPDRTSSTLVPIIESNLQIGSIIFSEECPFYGRLRCRVLHTVCCEVV